MKYLLLLLTMMLVGCTIELEERTKERVQDAYSDGYDRCTKDILEEKKLKSPKIHYNEKVEVIKGFYFGMCGLVVNYMVDASCNEGFAYALKVKDAKSNYYFCQENLKVIK